MENIKGKTKTKSAHTIDVVDEPTLPKPPVLEKPKDCKAMDRLYRFDDKFLKGGKWWNQSLKFPCTNLIVGELAETENLKILSAQAGCI